MIISQRGLAKCSVAALALCAMSSVALAETELRITHSMPGGDNKAAMDTIIAKFEETHPDITVTQIAYDDDTYSNTGLITQLQSNEVPDIYFQWAGFPVQRDAEAGFAMDLTDAMADGWKDTFIDSAFSEGAGTTVDGKIFMVPWSLDVTNTIWYNTEIFEENGLTPPETWDDFIALSKTLADAGETPIITGNNELWPLGNWASHVAARMIPTADLEAAYAKDKTFAEAGFLAPLQKMAELHAAGALNPDMQGLGADPAMAAFFQGAAAMHPIGSWLVASEGDMADEGFEYGQFDTPLIDPAAEAPDSVIGTLTGFIIHARSEHPEEAIEFMKFATTPEMQKIWAESGSISPVKGVAEVAEVDPHMASMAEMLSNASAMVPPPDTTYPVPLAEAWYQAAAYAASGEKTPEEALTWLDDTVAAMND